ncbi:MAG: hypothetical protein LBQ00_07090 [Syntrophobacterales bacterium]|jgi:hypothetical protein|nr:hypothetical protein [Syntrophobacterales bacterium]
MNENEKLILSAAVACDEKKMLSCAKAHRLAQEHEISLKEIGDTCNRLGIKITECELGCFK